MSAMAMVTSPRMISGMEKLRNSLKIPLNVTNIRTNGAGKIVPMAIPKMIAIMMRGSRPILIFFILIFICLTTKIVF